MLKNANWVSHPCDMGFECPVLKKEFTVSGPVKNAKNTMSKKEAIRSDK